MNETEKPEQDAEAQKLALLEGIGRSLADLRKEAIDGRKALGIEDVWRQDEEHYAGIDDKNRHTFNGDWQSKPPGSGAPRSVKKNESIEFPNITRAYVDAAAARVGDIILPTDDAPWSLKNTPVAELEDLADGKLPQEVVAGMQQLGIPGDKQQQVAEIEKQQAAAQIQLVRDKAEQASKHIEDWMIEGQWHAEMRKVLHDACRIGSGVLKGPMPKTKRHVMWKDGKLVTHEETKPVSKRIPCWNFYPDPACGDSIHDGAYTWEVDFVTAHKLRALKDEMIPAAQEGAEPVPAYIHSQIDLCIEEGPKQFAGERKTVDGKTVGDAKLFEVWYYHGFAAKKDLEAAGCDCEGEPDFAIPAMFVMVNDRIIKATLNPLDTGDFPYDILPWKRRQNMPWGEGVAREGRTAQRIVTAATRVMLTNAGRAAGPIIVRRRGAVIAGDGIDEITPWKIFDVIEDDTRPVGDLMKLFEIPDRQQSLQAIINYGLKMMEDTTGLPMLLQGQVGSAPDTLGGQQLAERNANSVLRRIAREVDDSITEPHLRRYYTYFLLYGPDEKKGDFILDARGSTDLVEREIYKNEVAALMQASLNPAFELSPARTMTEHLRITKKRPDDFRYTKEELEQMKKAQSQQQPDPTVEAAKVRAEADKFNAEQERISREAVAESQLKQKIMEYSEKRGQSLDQIKADLASLVLTLRAQKEEAAMQREHDTKKHVDKTRTDRRKNAVAAKPAFEPPGQAEPGLSFSQ